MYTTYVIRHSITDVLETPPGLLRRLLEELRRRISLKLLLVELAGGNSTNLRRENAPTGVLDAEGSGCDKVFVVGTEEVVLTGRVSCVRYLRTGMVLT